MKVYGQAVVAEFARRYAASRKPLARFLAVVSAANWNSFVDVRQSFSSADYAPKTGTLVFDIGGNKYRLIGRVDFAERTVFIQRVFTHEQYIREEL